MTAPHTKPRAWEAPREGIFERTERKLGRTDWTVADYREAGRREFDERGYVEGSDPWRPSHREHYASAYVQLNCPPAKLQAARAASRAEADQATEAAAPSARSELKGIAA